MGMISELNEIRRKAGLPLITGMQLTEAAPSAKRLLPMFSGILQLMPKKQDMVNDNIDWAREYLEREDRVIWFLRLVQVDMLRDIRERTATRMTSPMLQPYEREQEAEFLQKVIASVEKKLNQISNKNGIDIHDVPEDLSQRRNSTKDGLIHYFSLPIPKIQTLIFDRQNLASVMDEFQEWENDWKSDQNRMMEPDQDADKILDFGDGYAWYNLNKAYCSKEAEAMGHCGNSPRSYSNDRILSLRRDVKVGNEIYHSPVLTFILNDEGYLTEMKGRGNDKPAEKYHKYIVPLLMMDEIEGIVGGGYLPGNNFNISDLDEETKEELLDKKPALSGPMGKIDEKLARQDVSVYQDILDLANENFHYRGAFVRDLPTEWKNMYIIDVELDSWSDYHDVVREFFWDSDEVYDAIDNAKDEIEENSFDINNEKLVSELISLLPEERLKDMAEEIGLSERGSKTPLRYPWPVEALVDYIQEAGEKGAFYDFIQAAVAKSSGSISSENALKGLNELLAEYIDDVGIYLYPGELYVAPVDSDDPLDMWHMTVNLQDLYHALESYLRGGEDYDYDEHAHLAQALATGEHEFDTYNHDERRNEMGWSDEEVAEQIEELVSSHMNFNFEDMARQLDKDLQRGFTSATSSENQYDLKFEAHLKRLKRLAGIL